MRKRNKWIMILLLLGITVAVLAGGGYRFNYPYPDDPYRLQTYPLNHVKSVLSQMEDDRMIFSARLVSLLLILTGLDTRLKKGVYEIDNRMGLHRILEKWLTGEQKIVTVTIKEGDDLFNIGTTLLQSGILTDEGYWIDLTRSPKALNLAKQSLGFSPETKLYTLEGLLYPDTYYLFAGSTPWEFIGLALEEFRKRTQYILSMDLSDEYKLALFKMASLVEKETAVPEEKPLVASVLYNRLRIDMKLRFDPTVIYTLKVTGKYYQNFKDDAVNIKREHYKIASPYNTYHIKGLPLTPISSFTLSSLESVMNPPQTEYLFFVAKKKGKPQEGHYFTTNYEDHQRNIQKMLRSR